MDTFLKKSFFYLLGITKTGLSTTIAKNCSTNVVTTLVFKHLASANINSQAMIMSNSGHVQTVLFVLQNKMFK